MIVYSVLSALNQILAATEEQLINIFFQLLMLLNNEESVYGKKKTTKKKREASVPFSIYAVYWMLSTGNCHVDWLDLFLDLVFVD